MDCTARNDLKRADSVYYEEAQMEYLFRAINFFGKNAYPFGSVRLAFAVPESDCH
jgi:hypothetical protein